MKIGEMDRLEVFLKNLPIALQHRLYSADKQREKLLVIFIPFLNKLK